MGRFSDALQQGLDAQARLKRAQADVRTVLGEVSADISTLLSTEVQFGISKRTRFVEGLQTKINAALGILPAKSQEQFWVIEAHVTDRGAILLAEIEFADVGYPISLRWPERYAHIPNQEAVAPAIEDLLRSQHAGEKLEVLLDGSAKDGQPKPE